LLKQRLTTALVLIPIALVAIFWLPLDWFAWVIGGVLVLAAWEWSPLMGVKHAPGRILYCLFTGSLIGILGWFTPIHSIWTETGIQPSVLYPVIIGSLWWLLAIFMIFNFPKSRCVWARSRIFVGVFGVLILVPAWAALMALRALNYEQSMYFGSFTVLYVFALVWAADVGAYFAGKKFGKHKLMPEVSPGKTKEGFVGGLVLSICVMAFVAFLIDVPRSLLLSFFLMSIATAVVSVFGDLNESMFKRCAGVKDSGSLLPGHGGILDRIDSLTSALPIFLVGYLWLIHSPLSMNG